MKPIATKIMELIEFNTDVPHEFKAVLKKESAFTKDEEILDVVYLEKEYFNHRKESSNVYTNAKLLVATTHGIVLTEEGMPKNNTNLPAYNTKYFMYEKIASIELETCMLQGILKIHHDTGGNEGTEIEFNTTKQEHHIEAFVNVVRKKMIDCLVPVPDLKPLI